jgi:hypothetical protein
MCIFIGTLCCFVGFVYVKNVVILIGWMGFVIHDFISDDNIHLHFLRVSDVPPIKALLKILFINLI